MPFGRRTTYAGAVFAPRRMVYSVVIRKTYACSCSRSILEHNRTIIAVSKHVIAQNALSSGSISIGVEEAAQVGVVIPGLEVVETGFSVLRLTAMPGYALDTHTKPNGFRVGASNNPMILDQDTECANFVICVLSYQAYFSLPIKLVR